MPEAAAAVTSGYEDTGTDSLAGCEDCCQTNDDKQTVLIWMAVALAAHVNGHGMLISTTRAR